MQNTATGLGVIFCGVVLLMILFAIMMAALVAGGIAIAANPGCRETFGIILTFTKPEASGLFAFLAIVVTAITMLRYVNTTRLLRKAILAR